MADLTNLESLQTTLAQQHEEAVRTQALQQVLEAFAPGTLQSPVGYRVLLTRVRAVLDDALASTTSPDPLLPTPPSPPPDHPEGDAYDV